MNRKLPSTTASQPDRRIPPAPAGFKAEQFFEGTFWYQKWQIFEGIFTPGQSNSVEHLFDHILRVPPDLTDKRVLDIGAWNGCTSFECERRGAREVIALGPENPAHTGFNKIRDAIGSTKTHYVLGTVYDLNPDKLGYFDVVLFSGVLYHLRYPLLGIDNLRRVCTSTVFIETFVTDNAWVSKEQQEIKQVPLQDVSPKLMTDAVWQFYRSDELFNDASNWFGPNTTAVIQAFESAGFDTCLLQTWGSRAAFRAQVRAGIPEFLAVSNYDRLFYDVLHSPVLGKRDLMGKACGIQTRINFFSSEEYFQNAGGSDATWFTSLYLDLVGRRPTVQVLSTVDGVAHLDAHERERIVAETLASADYHRRLLLSYYRNLLGRTPAEHEITGWMNQLRHGSSDEEVLCAFISSAEYFQRSGSTHAAWLDHVQRDLLGRKSTSASQRSLEGLNNGTQTRALVAASIVASAEYQRAYAERLASHPVRLGDNRHSSPA